MGGRSSLEVSLKWLEDLSKGKICHELEAITMEGLKVLQLQKGFIRCNFLVPNRLSVSITYLSLIITHFNLFFF
jgi:hypothetical protein